MGAGFGKRYGCGAPNATAGAGDQGDFAGEGLFGKRSGHGAGV
jgi:hypothetical protein